MPITKSAKKALRQNLKRRKLNIWRKRRLREMVKKFQKLVVDKKINEAEKLLPQVHKIIDKSAKVNLIKKNTASRKKSQLAKMLQRTSKASQ